MSPELRDLAGRDLSLPRPARRLILGEGRFLQALSLLHPNPVSLIAAWRDDIRNLDPAGLNCFTARFPAVRGIPSIAGTSISSFSVERALTVGADLAVFSLGLEPPAEVRNALRQAGIPSMVIDFRLRPLDNVAPSLRLLGQAIGCVEAAEAFALLHEEGVVRVDECLRAVRERPSVLVEYRPTVSRSCCRVPGQDGLGEILLRAGGRNIAGTLPGAIGEIGLEFVMSQDPDVYVGTGSASDQGSRIGIRLGYGIGPADGRASLRQALTRPGIAELRAVRTGRAYGLWHNFYNNPCGVLALQAMARWLHPEACAGIDPDALLAEINERFLAVPMQGTFWVDA